MGKCQELLNSLPKNYVHHNNKYICSIGPQPVARVRFDVCKFPVRFAT
jgi:hypothetical protein